MKLYIPVSSRNFNCIFSEESISPRAFYKARGFGYSNWHGIPENPYENCTILYDELKSFSRPNEGYDDYPMVIETDVPDRIRGLMNQDRKTKSYAYDGVLYFSPRNTRFIFFDSKHRDIALSKASGSLETKLVNVYSKQITVEKAKGNYEAPVIEEPILNESEMALSQRINKVKGFSFGYYVGSLLSASREQAGKIQKYQSILNIAAAITSSIDKRPTQRQIEQLQALCLNNPMPKALAREFKIEEGTANSILSYLIQHGWTPDEQTNSGNRLYNSIITPGKQEEAVSWLSSQLEATLGRISGEWRIDPAKKDIEILPDASVEINRYKVDGKELQYKLLSYWVNNIFSDNKYEGSLSAYRSMLADDLTVSAKEKVHGDSWQDSKTRLYMNAVRRNIAGEEFSEKWSDGILCSVAAVLMKGDTWEGLRKFMLSESLHDYTLAFAFYGMLTGFANMPRDFMDILLGFADKNYPMTVYCSVSDMVANVRLNMVKEEDLPEDDLSEAEPVKERSSIIDKVKETGERIIEKILPPSSVTSAPENVTEPILNFDEKVDENPEMIEETVLYKGEPPMSPKVEQVPSSNENAATSKRAQDMVAKIEELFPAGKADRDKKIAYYSEQLYSIFTESNIFLAEIINKIESIRPYKKNDGWGKVRDELLKDLKSKVKLEKIQAEKEQSLQNPGLFPEQSYVDREETVQRIYAEDISFLADPNAWTIICSQLQTWGCDSWSIDLIKMHFDLFRNEYKPSFYHPFKKETVQGKFVNLPKDNESVLEKYRENLNYRKERKPTEYKKVKVDSLIWTLKDHYRK